MPEQHAYLTASGSKRWLSCPPSVRLEAELPPTTSEAAREGTFAHRIAEAMLTQYLQTNTLTGALPHDDKYSSQELDEHVERYRDLCIERYHDALSYDADAIMLVEQRLDFGRWVPGGFGTADCVIASDAILDVIDLKYGKGIKVEAEGNTQMQLYALGAIEMLGTLYNFERVRMTIVQPRLDHIAEQTMTRDALLAWGSLEVRPLALMALAGDTEPHAGAHCRFCRAAPTCRAYSDYCLEWARRDFAPPTTLADDEVAEILGKAEDAAAYARLVKEYALYEALRGHKWPGYKLVEGRSRRICTDPAAAAQRLIEAGYKAAEVYKPQELRGVTDLTKLVGKKKFETLLSDLLVKPEGKPALVPDYDQRPALDDLSEFANLVERGN